MNLLQLLIGQIPEAIYFALFLIYTKNIKNKKTIFIISTIVEYLLWKYTFQYSFIFHIGFLFSTYILLKVLYKKKSQITDIFILVIGYLIMMLFSFICYPLIFINYTLAVVVNRILMFLFIFLFRNKLNKIQKIYKLLWNRNDKQPKKIKSVTFRCINVIIFNFIFYILNSLMIYILYYNSR